MRWESQGNKTLGPLVINYIIMLNLVLEKFLKNSIYISAISLSLFSKNHIFYIFKQFCYKFKAEKHLLSHKL